MTNPYKQLIPPASQIIRDVKVNTFRCKAIQENGELVSFENEKPIYRVIPDIKLKKRLNAK